MKNRVLVMVSAVWLTAWVTGAIADQATSPEHEKCIDKSGGVTAEILACDGAELKRQDKRLNAAYQKLMGEASEEQKAALRDAQRLWLSYRKTNCDLIYKFGGGGTIDSIGASSCEVGILAQRVKFLETLSLP